jgi:hypothetical protein
MVMANRNENSVVVMAFSLEVTDGQQRMGVLPA